LIAYRRLPKTTWDENQGFWISLIMREKLNPPI